MREHVDPHLDDGTEVRQQLQEDASGYLARRLQAIHRVAARSAVDSAHWLVVL